MLIPNQAFKGVSTCSLRARVAGSLRWSSILAGGFPDRGECVRARAQVLFEPQVEPRLLQRKNLQEKTVAEQQCPPGVVTVVGAIVGEPAVGSLQQSALEAECVRVVVDGRLQVARTVERLKVTADLRHIRDVW